MLTNSEKKFTFTVDDNIRFLRELTQAPEQHLFDHPYPALWKKLHERYGVKIQLNLFYEEGGFRLCDVTDRLKPAFADASDWLKFSFHSAREYPAHPYSTAPGKQVLSDCLAVQREIRRFAGERSLAKTTTLHYCTCTDDGVEALRTAGVRGLLGLFGTEEAPRSSYQLTEPEAQQLRRGLPLVRDGMLYANIQAVLNGIPAEKISGQIRALTVFPAVSVMIHEQYFYPDYRAYQPDFAQKVEETVAVLTGAGFRPSFLEEWLPECFS